MRLSLLKLTRSQRLKESIPHEGPSVGSHSEGFLSNLTTQVKNNPFEKASEIDAHSLSKRQQ